MRALRRRLLTDFSPVVRRALKIDISAALFLTVFTGLTGPFTSLILRRDFDAAPLQLSVLASAGAAFGLLSLVWVRLLHGRRPLALAVWPAFLARGLFLLVPFVRSAWSFVAVLGASGLLASVAEPAQVAVTQRVYPRAQRGRAMATVRLVAGVVAVAVALVAGHLLYGLSYRLVFPLAAVAGMAASLRYWRMPVPREAGEAPLERPGLRGAVRALGADAHFRRLLTAQFLFGFGVWLQKPANPILLHDVLHASTSQVGIFVAAAAVAAMAASGAWGRLADRWSSVRVLGVVYAIGAVTPLVLYVARTPWLMVLTSATEAITTTGLETVWTLALMESSEGRHTAQYVGISATLTGIRAVTAPLLGGLVIDQLGVHAVYLLAFGCMVCAPLWLSATPRPRPDRALAVGLDGGVPQPAAG